MTRENIRNIVLLWLAWSVIIIGYMHFASYRYSPERPDDALVWTAGETGPRSRNNQPFLRDPFFNELVAWDSEYYLSIAEVGYDNPEIRLDPSTSVAEANGESYNLSYAFFPLYPYLMRVLRLPFTLFGLSGIAASTAAGVLISLLGTLAGMVALYDIVRDELGDEGGMRTIYMMLIFPSSLFFAVVYTEGLFVGLAFSSLALMRRKHLIAAAVLAAFATWTRAIGATLLAPLVLSWMLEYYQSDDKKSLLQIAPLMLLPVLAYGIWRWFYGVPFEFVESNFFGNSLLDLELTQNAWNLLLERAETFRETQVIVFLGVGSIILAVLSCLLTARKYPRLALFGFFALLIPLTGGWTGTQSAFRYVLAIPTLWVMLGQWAKNPIFERAWILFSILLLGMQAFLFSFDFWVA